MPEAGVLAKSKPKPKPKRRVARRAGPDALRLRRQLLRWFRAHAREFFWRDSLGGVPLTRFQVLLVEFLLWKTSARSAPTIQAIVMRYPEAADLLSRTRAQLEGELRPLGLFRRRAHCLSKLSRELVERHDGRVPSSVRELSKLTGIGQYASRATACVLESSRLMPVDANTSRIFGRVYGEEGPHHRKPGPTWDARFEQIVPRREPRRFLWATMDLAARVCTPRNPDCPRCPLRDECVTGQRNLRER